MTISRRLVLATSGAVATAVALGSIATYVVVRHDLRSQVDDELSGAQPQVVFASHHEPRPAGQLPALSGPPPRSGKKVRVELRSDGFGGATGIAQVVGRDGARIKAASSGAALPITGLTRKVAAGRVHAVFADEHVKGVHLRVLTQRTSDGDVLQVGRSLTEMDGTLSRLRWVLLAVTLAGIGLAAGLGIAVARGTLRPVRRLSAGAEQVADTRDLEHRLPVEGRDELSTLAASFNTMLGALGKSREAQRQLVADASHELRTPLTSARTNIALLDRAPDLDAGERGRVVGAIGDQLAELTVLVDDLVDLARDSDQQNEQEREDVRLDLLAADAVRSAQLHAPGSDIRLSAEPTVIHGVPSRLDRAVRNLLDNALKHGPPDKPVEVTVHDGVISVRDHGPGIAVDDLPHVFDRFYRAPAARGLPGSGLGLAIVRQVADMHGGTVSAGPAPGGGALLELALPPSPASAELHLQAR
jgi:two-component system sensor histidine kinase MprB